MMRTASIKLEVTPAQSGALRALRTAYAEACNVLVPVVQAQRVWNRVALHQLGYTALREHSPLGSQMCCNAIYTVCQAVSLPEGTGVHRRPGDHDTADPLQGWQHSLFTAKQRALRADECCPPTEAGINRSING